MWWTCQGINRAGCPPAGCARVNATLPRTAWKFSEKHRQKKLTTTLTGQKVYKCSYPIDKSSRSTSGNWSLLKQLVQFSTYTVWILQVCLVQLISITAQVTVVNTWGGLNGNGAGSGWSDQLGGVSGATPLCTKTYNEQKIHLTERMRVSWQCGWAHHSGLDTGVIASQNCVSSWAHLPVHVKGWRSCWALRRARGFLLRVVSVCMNVRELEPEGLWVELSSTETSEKSNMKELIWLLLKNPRLDGCLHQVHTCHINCTGLTVWLMSAATALTKCPAVLCARCC